MRDYSVLIFQREPVLADVLESIVRGDLREYRLSTRIVHDFVGLREELSMNSYDVLVTGLLNWRDEDYTGFRGVIESFPHLQVVIARNGGQPDDLAERSNTVITPTVSTRISRAVLEMLMQNSSEQSRRSLVGAPEGLSQ